MPLCERRQYDAADRALHIRRAATVVPRPTLAVVALRPGGNLNGPSRSHFTSIIGIGSAGPIASPPMRYTERQYAAMQANGKTFVVTPQILLQGHELPASRRSMPQPALDKVAAEPAAASIELTAATMAKKSKQSR
jgi:hypothetical protein